MRVAYTKTVCRAGLMGNATPTILVQIQAKGPDFQPSRTTNSRRPTWSCSRLHVEVAAWADTYAAIFANFALTSNCVCHVQPVRAEQASEFGALARQGRVTGYPSDNHRITIFLSGLFLCFLNVGDRENASAVRAFGCGV